MRFFILQGWVCLLISLVAMAAPGSPGDGQVIWEGQLQKKSKSIRGTVRIVQTKDQLLIQFDENFKTKSGPDLKIVFSPTEFGKVKGKTAMQGAHLVDLLKETSGFQTYSLPKDFDWKNYKSLLVHCEKYAVLWGGAALE